MEFGHASDSGMRSILTAMCEHTGFVELYPMEIGQATAERAADALVVFILRWGTPDTMWQAHDSQLQGEVVRRVCERLDIKIMSTTPCNKNATAKQERKHLLVAQILKRLHGGHPNTWDQHLPLAEHRLRNTTLVHHALAQKGDKKKPRYFFVHLAQKQNTVLVTSIFLPNKKISRFFFVAFLGRGRDMPDTLPGK
jgi:hypothetical protein